MKKLPRILVILLIAALMLNLAACGKSNVETPDAVNTAVTGSTSSSDEGDKQPTLNPHKIAVAFASVTNAEIMQKTYLQEVIGPAFNTEFVFSEELNNAEAVITFLETAYASGCEGVMVFPTDGLEQVIAKADELGIYVVANAAKVVENVKNLPHYVGNVSSGAKLTAESFEKIVWQLVDDGEKHNVVIVSGGAGMGSSQHYECTSAILQVLQSTYNLTYSKPIEEIARSTSPLEVDTGTDIKVYIYPGFPTGDTYVSGLSSELQTGEYDTVICCYNVFSQFSVAIDEVEKAFSKNIRVVSLSSVDDTTSSAFNTLDAFGNPSIDAVVVKPLCALSAEMFVLLYNSIEGGIDQICQTPGEATMFIMPMWYAYGAEEYQKLANLDNSIETYAFKPDDLADLLIVNNPDIDYETIYLTWYNSTAQSLMNK